MIDRVKYYGIIWRASLQYYCDSMVRTYIEHELLLLNHETAYKMCCIAWNMLYEMGV